MIYTLKIDKAIMYYANSFELYKIYYKIHKKISDIFLKAKTYMCFWFYHSLSIIYIYYIMKTETPDLMISINCTFY